MSQPDQYTDDDGNVWERIDHDSTIDLSLYQCGIEYALCPDDSLPYYAAASHTFNGRLARHWFDLRAKC